MILSCLRAERVTGEWAASYLVHSCLLFVAPGKQDWECSEVTPVLDISIAGIPVGGGKRRMLPMFSDKLLVAPAKLHAFKFGSGLRSHAQLLNPLQTTGQMMACGDSESFISLLFLTSLESRNHRRKPIISKWVFWVFRVKRAQEKEKKKHNWCWI